MIRILLADDHEVVRRGLRELVATTHLEWEVCSEEASNGREAAELAARLKPDVAIVDLAMPEESGIGLEPTPHVLVGLEAVRRIRHVSPRTEVLVFSMHDNEQLVYDVRASGAKGYVLKSESSQHLVAAIEALVRHQHYFSGLLPTPVLADSPWERRSEQSQLPRENRLTPRQRAIVQLLVKGMTVREIASALTISVKTAKTHRAAIRRRLGARNTVEVVLYAMRTGLAEP